MPAPASIALGSNQGDRRAHIGSALRAVGALPGTSLIAASNLYETAPIGMPAGEPSFLNAAAVIRTDLPPRDLLKHLLRIEREHGRTRTPGERWGSRTLDLDLLTYADRVISEPCLIIPHPRLHERLFVLEPLASIAPDLVIPTLSRTARELLEELRHAPRILPGDSPP